MVPVRGAVAGAAMSADVAVQSQESISGSPSTSGRTATGYHVCYADKQLFAERGYVHLPGVMSEEEMQQEIDEVMAVSLSNSGVFCVQTIFIWHFTV